jgi:Tol biopolymer transport system component
VSPDGRTLSVIRLGPSPTDAALITVDLATGREKQLTRYDADVAIKTGWSPNSRRIVFTRDAFTAKPGISPNIWTIGRNGHAKHAVTRFSGGDVKAIAGSYSPDGRWIVFRREEPSGAGLWIIRPNGRQAKLIFTDPDVIPRYIDWGPRRH